MLTEGARIELLMPFLFSEHGFVPQKEGDLGGAPYIQKNAIRKRLDRVCPNWSISEPRRFDLQDDVVFMTAILTIDGQSHGGLGSGVIQRYKRDGTMKPPFEVSREVVKAYKTAAQDCLPRAAQFFGVGWYLRGIPKQYKDAVKTPQGLEEYLKAVKAAIEKSNAETDKARELLGNGNGNAERRIR